MIAIIICGSLGILSFLIWELLTWKGKNKVAFVMMVLFPLLTVVYHILILTGPRLSQSIVEIIVGAIILVVSCYLLYRSLWAELPKESYTGDMGSNVCKNGTYAL